MRGSVGLFELWMSGLPSAVLCPESTSAQDIDREEENAEIRRSLQGDASAYARLVRRYESAIASQLWRFTRDRGVLEELVQDTFVEAYFSLKGYRGDAPFVHWLRKIATRVGYRHWKRESQDRRRRQSLEESAEPSIVPGPGSAPAQSAEFLYRLLEELRPEDRLILTLQYFEECDTEEMARRTGWNRTLVKVRAHRARNRLRALLEARGLLKEDYA